MASRTIALAGVGAYGIHVFKRLVADGKHKIVVLSRSERPDLVGPNVRVVQVDYDSVDSLAAALAGVDTVINLIFTIGLDKLEINLITAAVRAGVARYAPSEWNTDTDRYPNKIVFYAEKEKFHAWLRDNKPAIRIAKFFTGTGAEYLGSAQKAANLGIIVKPVETAHATIVGTGDEPLTVSVGPDVAAYVAAYIGASDEVWTGNHGIESERTSWNKLLSDLGTVLGNKIERRQVSIEEQEKKLQDPNMMVAWVASWQVSMARGETIIEPTARRDFPEIKTTSLLSYFESVKENYA